MNLNLSACVLTRVASIIRVYLHAENNSDHKQKLCHPAYQGRIYSKQDPVRKKMWGPVTWGGRPYFSAKNGRPFWSSTVAFIHFTRSLGCRPLFPACKKFAAPLVGPLFVGLLLAEHVEHA